MALPTCVRRHRGLACEKCQPLAVEPVIAGDKCRQLCLERFQFVRVFGFGHGLLQLSRNAARPDSYQRWAVLVDLPISSPISSNDIPLHSRSTITSRSWIGSA